jgi:hypothetical protein
MLDDLLTTSGDKQALKRLAIYSETYRARRDILAYSVKLNVGWSSMKGFSRQPHPRPFTSGRRRKALRSAKWYRQSQNR